MRMGRPFDLVPDGVWARLRRRWLPRALSHFNFELVTTHRCVAQHRQVFRGNQCPQLRVHKAGRVRSDDVQCGSHEAVMILYRRIQQQGII